MLDKVIYCKPTERTIDLTTGQAKHVRYSGSINLTAWSETLGQNELDIIEFEPVAISLRFYAP